MSDVNLCTYYRPKTKQCANKYACSHKDKSCPEVAFCKKDGVLETDILKKKNKEFYTNGCPF